MVEKNYLHFNAVVHKEIIISVFHNAEYYSITVGIRYTETKKENLLCIVQCSVCSLKNRRKIKRNGGTPADIDINQVLSTQTKALQKTGRPCHINTGLSLNE